MLKPACILFHELRCGMIHRQCPLHVDVQMALLFWIVPKFKSSCCRFQSLQFLVSTVMTRLPLFAQDLAREGNAVGVKLSELPHVNGISPIKSAQL